MSDVDLSILIISYNTRELTLACLRSVYEQTQGIGFEVIAVDNASTDGSAEALAGDFPQVRLLQPERNLGFAAANNLAVAEARGEYLLLLNPDTVVLDSALVKLHAFAVAHPEAGIVGGRTLHADRSLNPASCWRAPTLWSMLCRVLGLSHIFRGSRLFDPEVMGHWARDSVREVDIVTGCLLMCRLSLWLQLGGFDSDFFMYGEEVDLCLRAAKLGHKCLIDPEATIIHYGGASERILAEKMVNIFLTKAKLFRKHWHPFAAWLGVALLWLWAFSRMAAGGVIRWRRAEAREAWRVLWRRRKEWYGT